MRLCVLLMLSLLAAACDDGGADGPNPGAGGSAKRLPGGLDKNKALKELTTGDKTLLCAFANDMLNGEFECDGMTITLEPDPQCVEHSMFDQCTGTVGDLVDCLNESIKDICSPNPPPACLRTGCPPPMLHVEDKSHRRL